MVFSVEVVVVAVEGGEGEKRTQRRREREMGGKKKMDKCQKVRGVSME